MKSKKLTIALISVAIIVAVSVVGVTFAVWDITSQNKNFDTKIGHGLDFKITNQINNGTADALKDFAPIAAGDVTNALVSVKLASFDVVSTTTDPSITDTTLSYTNVKATYTVMAGAEDLSSYVNLYILNDTDYLTFVDGSVIPASATLLASETAISHSVAGFNQGIVIAWKDEVIAQDYATNAAMIAKMANKTIKVNLTLIVAIVEA